MTARSDSGTAALFEGFVGIDARCVPCWCGAEEQASESCDADGEEQDGNVQAEIYFGRESALGHDGDQALQYGVAYADPEQASGDG